jgi:hypothetical protein
MAGLLLYSVNAFLAWAINERYYDGRHYVWCGEAFDTRALGPYSQYSSTPPSSAPREIYADLLKAVRAGDRGSQKVAAVKLGIVNGARNKLSSGEIEQDVFDEISLVVDQSELRDCRPLLYVIPRDKVDEKLRGVEVSQRAHPLSVEYIAENVHSSEFDVIEFSDGS